MTRYLVFGAGAIGGVVGARLSEAGREVELVARGEHLAALRRGGLTLRAPDGERTLSLRALAHPSEHVFSADSAVLLAVKTQDAGAALDELRACAPPGTPVVCLQNGVEAARLALRRFERVIGAMLMLPTSHLEPGAVVAHSAPVPGIVDLGRFPSGGDPLLASLVADLRRAGFASEARDEIQPWQYAKLLTNLLNAVQAACGTEAELGDLPARLRAEGEVCLRAAGIRWVGDREFRERHRGVLKLGRVAGQERAGGSSWQSLARGTGSIEADFLNGEIALLGRLQGVPVPLNAGLQQLAARLARERRPPGSVSPDELRRLLAGSF
jgi:2-dehydropantoate 2-reductase